jgi:hypothetical protein
MYQHTGSSDVGRNRVAYILIVGGSERESR